MATRNETKAEARQRLAHEKEEAQRRSKLVKSSLALQPYGTPEELREMMTRARFMVQGGDKLTDAQLWALSAGSIALGLNPLAKEICMVGDVIFPQIRGVRRKGREQIVYDWKMSPPLLNFYDITDPIEREMYKIPQGALAQKCIGMIAEERTLWADDMQKVSAALFGPKGENIVNVPNSHEIILAQVGEMPQTIGIGYITAEEMWERDNPRWWHVCKKKENNTDEYGKGAKKYLAYTRRGHDPCPDCGRESWATVNRYPHIQCARKRAEAHFWYQKCDLPFDIKPSGEGLADFEGDEEITVVGEDISSTEGIYTDIPEWAAEDPDLLERFLELRSEAMAHEEETKTLTPEEIHARAQEGADALFGGEPPKPPPPEPKDEPQKIDKKRPRSWGDECVEFIKESGAVPPDKAGRQITRRIINVLNRSPFNDDDNYQWIVDWLKIRYELRDKGLDSDVADTRANALWVASFEDHNDLIGRFGADWVSMQVEIAKALEG